MDRNWIWLLVAAACLIGFVLWLQHDDGTAEVSTDHAFRPVQGLPGCDAGAVEVGRKLVYVVRCPGATTVSASYTEGKSTVNTTMIITP